MKYPKIQTVLKRDPSTNFKTLIPNQFSLPEFRYLAKNKWVYTEKVDGTNIRICWDGETVDFRGRTDRAHIPPGLKEALAHMFNEFVVGKLISMFPDGNVCLYGEGYGKKIQKVGHCYNQNGNSFVLFDVLVGDWWLQRDDVEDVAVSLGLDVVPVIGTGNLFDMVTAAKIGFKSTWGDFQAEGIVARPETELKGRDNRRIITKVKCRDFS